MGLFMGSGALRLRGFRGSLMGALRFPFAFFRGLRFRGASSLSQGRFAYYSQGRRGFRGTGLSGLSFRGLRLLQRLRMILTFTYSTVFGLGL
jgi:hypothetical protein|uniref:Uncharacterized protein n=2 Tax=Picea TaxID=3328 RepID=A0A117NHS4_PICGL|nr:hypothetical protein ABT39_MTgene4154 [Picea glauca]QHR90338.1 hypothetical protein Q903MT_gene4361 [Picea sitchensis]